MVSFINGTPIDTNISPITGEPYINNDYIDSPYADEYVDEQDNGYGVFSTSSQSLADTSSTSDGSFILEDTSRVSDNSSTSESSFLLTDNAQTSDISQTPNTPPITNTSEIGQTPITSPYVSLIQNPDGTLTIPPELADKILAGSGVTPPPEGYTFNTEEFTAPLQDYLKQINDINKGITDIAYKTAQQQALSAYIDAYIEAEATKKILQMNNQSTQANAILDQQQLALRQNYNILSKQVEMYTLDAQVREQLTNIFFTLEKTIMDNRFSLAKQVVSSAKY